MIEELNPQLNKQSLADYRTGQIARNIQLGVRLPNHLYSLLESERLAVLETGEKVTMTELVVKYLRLGLQRSSEVLKDDEIPLTTLERLTNVLERLESKF